jgi:hypothetical protein
MIFEIFFFTCAGNAQQHDSLIIVTLNPEENKNNTQNSLPNCNNSPHDGRTRQGDTTPFSAKDKVS